MTMITRSIAHGTSLTALCTVANGTDHDCEVINPLFPFRRIEITFRCAMPNKRALMIRSLGPPSQVPRASKCLCSQ